MAKKRLGIDALFQTTVPNAVPKASPSDTTEVEIERLAPQSRQPRTMFGEALLRDLTESIREHGVLQPILVRPGAVDGAFEIIAGERRWRAAKSAGLGRVPIRVLDLPDAEMLAVAMVENLQREDLNPLEEAEGYIELLRARLEAEAAFSSFFDASDARAGVIRVLRALNNRAAGNTKDNVVLSLEAAVGEVFARVGRITWQTFVSHRLPLIGLPEDLLAAMRSGGLEYTKARAIARLTADRLGGDAARARRVRRDLIDQAATEGLSVRGLQAEIARLLAQESAPKAATSQVRRMASIGTKRKALGAKLNTLRERLGALDLEPYEPNRRDEIDAAIDELLRLLD